LECKFQLWKTVWRLLKNLKIELPYDPVITFLGIYSRECTLGCNRATSTPMFTAALFTTVKLRKQPRCPISDEWINEM
jgi:hypothetical protein